jgi:hypothetical protein
MEEIVSETRLLGKSVRRQIVRVALGGDGLYRDVAFFDEVLDIGVDQAEGYAEAAGEVALRERIVVGQLIEDLEGTVLVHPGRGGAVDVHRMNIP